MHESFESGATSSGNDLAELRRRVNEIETATTEVGRLFDAVMHTDKFKKFIFLDPEYSRGDFIKREDRPCKRCKNNPRFRDAFHTSHECPLEGYDRVIKISPKEVNGQIAIRNLEEGGYWFYKVKRECIRL